MRRAVIRGWVQGVGFRHFVHQLAAELGLRGEVWNRIDGAVEAVYTHEDPAVLVGFERRLRSGPGRVDRVDTEELPSPLEFPGFRIGPTRP